MFKRLTFLTCLAVVGFLTTLAFAHAVLVDSSPKDNSTIDKAPDKIVLKFDARIEKKVFTATLKDKDGNKIDLPDAPQDDDPPDQIVLPMPALGPGSYRLEFQVLAADGHATPGLLRFTIAGDKKQ